MADVWTHAEMFPAGSTEPKRFEIGPPIHNVGYREGAIMGNLRIGFANGQPAQNFIAYVRLPDQGNLVGPIDVPCLLEMELPLTVILEPEAAPTTDVLVELAVSATGGRDSTYGGLRSVWVEDGNTIAIPQWTQAVSLGTTTATGQWLDAASAVIGDFAGNHNPRPRQAVQIQVNDADSLVIFHYTS